MTKYRIITFSHFEKFGKFNLENDVIHDANKIISNKSFKKKFGDIGTFGDFGTGSI